jgi:malonyl-CoA O-methyltransferase
VNQVDKARVRAAFSRGAAAYDARAGVQALVRSRVLGLAAEAAPRARRVLDVGCGTGRLLADLLQARPALAAAGVDLSPAMCSAAGAAAPRARVVAGDAEALPFRPGAFDLVVSTSTFQWLPVLEPALAECARVLAPRGRLVLCLFGAGTLHELTGAWRAAAAGRAPDRTHRFFTAGDVERALGAAGLRLHGLEEEERVEHHPDARAVLRSLKAIGAQNASPAAAGLSGRRTTLEMLRRYETLHGGPDGVPATWHMVYAVASR